MVRAFGILLSVIVVATSAMAQTPTTEQAAKSNTDAANKVNNADSSVGNAVHPAAPGSALAKPPTTMGTGNMGVPANGVSSPETGSGSKPPK